MDSKMKYYVYVSDAKVDMLYSQIGKSLLKKIAMELSIDLKPLGAGLGATIKQKQSEETRYSKLRLVVEYVEKHLNVGWVDAPGTYFKGSLPLSWGSIHSLEVAMGESQPYAVYFGGSTDRTIFGMVGSAHHMIGVRSDAPKSDIILLYTPNDMLNALANEVQPQSKQSKLYTYLILKANEQMGEPSQQMEFLAKTFLYKKEPEFPQRGSRFVLLGSPIFVAFAN